MMEGENTLEQPSGLISRFIDLLNPNTVVIGLVAGVSAQGASQCENSNTDKNIVYPILGWQYHLLCLFPPALKVSRPKAMGHHTPAVCLLPPKG